MNQAAGNQYAAADQKLNTVYRQVQQAYGKNPVFLKNLQAAQRIWLKYRDAEVALRFPDRPAGYYGSLLPVCKGNYLTELTEARTRHLAEWLKPAVEGDGCSGTLGEFESQ
jgi:uncharacterized protein YecT (DUF1311 family)